MVKALAFVLAAAASPAAAATQCDTSVVRSITAWEAVKSVDVPAALAQSLAHDLCASVDSIVADGMASRATAEAAVPGAATEYLNTYVSGRPLRSPGAVIRSKLGAAGLSRPVERTFVLVSFTYTKNLDELLVGSEKHLPRPKLLLPPGRVSFTGFWQGLRQCSGQVIVSFSLPSVARC